MGALNQLAKQMQAGKSAYVKVGVLKATSTRPMVAKTRSGQIKHSKFSKGLTVQNAQGQLTKVDAGHLNNAEIGAIHEFGSPGGQIPERSFLRMPILSRLDGEIQKAGNNAQWKAVFAQNGLKGVLDRVGKISEALVLKAFGTGGFGRWAQLKPSTIRKKGSSEILIETQSLEEAITYEVKS